MATRPIILLDHEVRALLGGRGAALIRRPHTALGPDWHVVTHRIAFGETEAVLERDGTRTTVSCPYGHADDTLWVREAFCWWQEPNTDHIRFGYRAGGKALPNGQPDAGWLPPGHMPRYASRLTLDVRRVLLVLDTTWVWRLDVLPTVLDIEALEAEEAKLVARMGDDYERLTAIRRLRGER